MNKLQFDRTDYSVVVKNRAKVAEPVEMGDLPRRKIEPDMAVNVLFSVHGGGQQGGKRGAQAAAG
jgi:hypothetical protein